MTNRLDELKFGFHVFEKTLLVMERKARLFDEFNRGFFDIARIIEASLKRVDFAAKFKDAIFEIGFILGVNIFWNLEIDIVVVLDSQTKTGSLGVLYLWDTWCLSEMLDEQLVTVNEIVVMEGNWVGLGAWEALEMTTNIGDDIDEFVELFDALLVYFVWFWPFLND